MNVKRYVPVIIPVFICAISIYIVTGYVALTQAQTARTQGDRYAAAEAYARDYMGFGFSRWKA